MYELVFYYIHQVNGVKVADILFSLLSVCLSMRVSVCTQSSLQQCVSFPLPQRISHFFHATHLHPQTHLGGHNALSEHLLVLYFVARVTTTCRYWKNELTHRLTVRRGFDQSERSRSRCLVRLVAAAANWVASQLTATRFR